MANATPQPDDAATTGTNQMGGEARARRAEKVRLEMEQAEQVAQIKLLMSRLSGGA